MGFNSGFKGLIAFFYLKNRQIFFVARLPLVGRGLFFVEASRSFSGTPLSVGLLWTSDHPGSETFS